MQLRVQLSCSIPNSLSLSRTSCIAKLPLRSTAFQPPPPAVMMSSPWRSWPRRRRGKRRRRSSSLASSRPHACPSPTPPRRLRERRRRGLCLWLALHPSEPTLDGSSNPTLRLRGHNTEGPFAQAGPLFRGDGKEHHSSVDDQTGTLLPQPHSLCKEMAMASIVSAWQLLCLNPIEGFTFGYPCLHVSFVKVWSFFLFFCNDL